MLTRLGNAWKALTTPTDGAKAVTRQEMLGATVTTGDIRGHRRSSYNPDNAQLLARVRSWPSILADLNAKACASQRMRLYKAGKQTTRTRRVSKSMRAYIASGRAGIKAADIGSRGGELVEVESHPILDLLNNPNPIWVGGTSLERLMFKTREVFGESFYAVEEGNEVPVRNLWPMYPAYVNPIPDENELLWGYTFGRSSEDVHLLPRGDVLHFVFQPSMSDPYRGSAWLQDVLAEADLIAANIEFDQEFVERGLHSTLAVGVGETVTDEQIKAAHERMRSRYQGVANMHDPIIIKGANSLTPLTMTAKDLQTQEKLEFLLQTLLAAAGIPESMVKLNDANLASASQGYSVQYLDGTVRPRINDYAEQLSELLLPWFGEDPDEMRFVYDNPVPEDLERQVTVYGQAVAQGLGTINEAREELGWERSDDPAADVLRINGQSLEALDRAPEPSGFGSGLFPVTGLMGSAPEVKQLPAAGSNGQEAVTIRDTISKAFASDPWADCCSGIHTKDDDDDFRTAKIRRLEKELAEIIQDELREIQRRAANGEETTQDDVKVLADLMRPVIKEFYGQGLTEVIGTLDESGFSDQALAFLDGYTIELAGDIAESTIEQTRATIEAGIANGESISDISKGLDEFAPKRAERIARTEVQTAVQGGKLAGFKELGVEGKVWQLAPGNCSLCEKLVQEHEGKGGQSKAIGLDEPFWPAGKAIVGADGRSFTPRGPVLTPPLHPNCRCNLLGDFGGDE